MERRLPLLYFGLSQAMLLAAFAGLAWDPAAIVTDPTGSRALGLAHLVTLGWISASILGSLYAIAPLALKSRMPAGVADAVAFALFATGTVGVAAGFLVGAPAVTAVSGSLVLAGALVVGWRTSLAIRPARIHGAVKLHVLLAFANLAAAGGMGMLHAPPATHVHVAALGWAVMMVAGIGYRMLPMVLPSSTPSGPTL
jgi:hypothetical protein